MDKLAEAAHFLDLGSFDSLRARAQQDDSSVLKEVAQQFEGIFVQMLMKSMRDANAVFESDSPMNSQYTQFYEQMHDQQMSLNLSSQGMLGLADLMVQQLSPETSQMLPASVLRADNNASGFTSNELTLASSEQNSHYPLAPNFLDKLAAITNGSVNESENNWVNSSTNNGVVHAANKRAVLDAASPINASRVSSSFSSLSLVSAPLPEAPQVLSPEAFVAKLYPYAQTAAAQLGTQAEVLIAQSALETGWGQKIIHTQEGVNSHNFFNIKVGKGWQGNSAEVDTLEFEQGKTVKQKAQFRVYDDIKQSFNDFVGLLTQGERYQAAMKQAQDPQAFMQGLQVAGYATDPQYAKKVLRVMQSITQDLLPDGVLK
ncbi:flagellar assembly peptidoglycan hydrolase FlgJ [Shewanella surugensis]|uniref:Peptidoglycan hydrolase FlgJ n=1 Tax=Shewanella surugensis TaxID=212020 RepID=A0ABT0LCN3_9GAMM|nr:flagellar assembly peptidoglycan hydrolase FlgJ [Shewanella surugensis]MCL1125453.1 flagellar assembly peptidoglycan hydrolase FlgJ [Shewanella surugensis]